MQDFANAITNLAPNKVTKKIVPHLISLRAEHTLKLIRRDFVSLAKVDIPFRDGYKQSSTDE